MDAYHRHKEVKEVQKDYCICLKGNELVHLIDFRASGRDVPSEKKFKLAGKLNDYVAKNTEKVRNSEFKKSGHAHQTHQ